MLDWMKRSWQQAAGGVAIVVVLVMTTGWSPLGSTQVVTGTIRSVKCDWRADNSRSRGIAISIGGRGDTFLVIDVLSEANIRQTYRVTSHRHCHRIPIAGTIKHYDSDFPLGGRIELHVRAQVHPDTCDKTGGQTDPISVFKRLHACTYQWGISKISVDGRKVYFWTIPKR